MKDILKASGSILLLFLGGIAFGWGVGWFSMWLFTPHVDSSVQPNRPVWYCIEGKIYENIGDFYVTVSPDRACLPVDKK